MPVNPCALLIFARRPLAGRVKTRLVPPLSPADAAELYRCMLQDTLAMAATLPGIDRFVFYVEEGDAGEYFRAAAPDCRLFPQEGDDLGLRMAGAFRQVFELGYERAAVIGTDIPDLPAGFVSTALERLERGVDAVFVPCEDGGYCLLALRRVYRELFEGIVWSTDEVLATSLMRAKEAGIAAELLPRWHDVDTVDDLRRPELLDETNGAVLTRAFIRRLGLACPGTGADCAATSALRPHTPGAPGR